MPHSQAAARMASAGLGGVHTTMRLTPATWAGMTDMSSDEGRGALPPGTYTPARATGTARWPSTPPRLVVSQLGSGCRAWNRRMRRAAVSIASACRPGWPA